MVPAQQGPESAKPGVGIGLMLLGRIEVAGFFLDLYCTVGRFFRNSTSSNGPDPLPISIAVSGACVFEGSESL